MKATAIVVAAGKGRRFKSRVKKPFVKLARKPLVTYALTVFENSPLIRDSILVVAKPLIKKAKSLVKKYRLNKVRHIIKGGQIRQESVKNGLKHLDKKTSLVLIHDGARPFITARLVKKVIIAAKRFGAAIPAVPIKPTIKVSEDAYFVSYTPKRNHLWEAQTPQAFRREVIENAYRKMSRKRHYTDDAVLVEEAGKKIRIVEGDYKNIKITTIEDLKIAEALLKERRL